MADLAKRIADARGWDAQMREIMLAAKYLSELPENERLASRELAGCESQVWLDCQVVEGQLRLRAWSPSKIVRGLLTVMFEPLQGQTVAAVQAFDMPGYLQELGLARHLSQSRGNGLKAVMQGILARLA